MLFGYSPDMIVVYDRVILWEKLRRVCCGGVGEYIVLDCCHESAVANEYYVPGVYVGIREKGERGVWCVCGMLKMVEVRTNKREG